MPNSSNNAQTVLHWLIHTWTDIDREFALIHVHTCSTNTCMHFCTPAINLMVTLGRRRFVTDVRACFISVYRAPTRYSHSVHSQELGGCLV